MRLLLKFFLFTAFLLIFTGCSSSSSPNVNPETVAGKIANNPDLSSLTKALQDAELFELLDDTRGSYTVFAPSNAAFAAYGALPQGDDLAKVLNYHIVNDVFNTATLTATAPTELETVDVATIAVTIVDDKLVLNGQVGILQADIAGSNGVVHIVDKVLVPPSTN